jgi:hypothetical protein
MGKSKYEFVFHVLGGLTYSEKERPRFWQNEVPLLCDDYNGGNAPDMKQLPLHEFLLIEDFQVILEEVRPAKKKRSTLGYHIRFFSPSRGYIANFPWWDDVEKGMLRDDFSIPLGDFMTPFSDLEQGWEIVIAEHDGYVYVLQGQFDQSPIKGYTIWFKVPKSLYLSKWQETIQACRRMEDEWVPASRET